MVWNSVWPDGTKSVKANTVPGQQNTTYIETTENKDHFWNIGTNEDGRHRFMQAPAFTSGGNPADPSLATGMNGVMYLRTVSADNGRVEGFYRNNEGIYQFVPSFKSGTVSITSTSTYVTITTVPDNSYGHIYLFTTTSAEDMSFGFFKADGGVVQAYSSITHFGGSSDNEFNHKFGNGSEANGLNIRARRSEAPSATYAYRIVYWGI